MLEKIFYLDMAAMPIYMIIWYTTVYRGMTKGRSNVLFLMLTIDAFLMVTSELFAAFSMYFAPPTEGWIVFTKAMEYIYFVTRNITNVFYLFFIFSVTRTWYRIGAWWKKVLLALPFLVILAMLLTNEYTQAVFTVTAEADYQRGDHVLILYALASFYVIFGLAYLVACIRTMDFSAWLALLLMYIFNIVAVVIQFFYPKLLVECYFTSVTLLFVILLVQRPENQMDMNTGLRGYRAFCEEIAKVKVTGRNIRIVIICINNADDMNRFLGDTDYYKYIYAIEGQIATHAKKERVSYELYFEQPGTFYIILDDEGYNPVEAISHIREQVRKQGTSILMSGALPDVRIVTVRFPQDIPDVEELYLFGHNFVRFADVDRIYTRASAILSQKEYQVEAHFGEIMDRAQRTGGLQVAFWPVWAVNEEMVCGAEAVPMLRDEEYGDIDGDLLIDAAERRGYIIRLGESIIEQVFTFIRDNDVAALGYYRITIGLSVAQCMQMNFADRLWELREKYGIHPEQIGFAIKESEYENLSGVLDENLRKLSMQGYGLALDGFGKGYSNMQRFLELPIGMVRLDRSMVSATTASDGGRALLLGSIRMLREIPLLVIADGADDEERFQMLCDMGCDFVQGRYIEMKNKGDS